MNGEEQIWHVKVLNADGKEVANFATAAPMAEEEALAAGDQVAYDLALVGWEIELGGEK